MNEIIRKIFIEKLRVCPNSIIDKAEIIKVGEECGVKINKRSAKATIVDTIIEEGYLENLYEKFNEYIYVPAWEVSDFYKVNPDQIDTLSELGFITEEPKKEEFYSRNTKSYYTVNTFPLSIFNYDPEELRTKYENLNKGVIYKIRVDTETKDEVDKIVNTLSQVLEIKGKPAIYSKRSSGYYSYFKVKELNELPEEEVRLTHKIKELEEKIEVLKKEKLKLYNEKSTIAEGILEKVKSSLGIEEISGVSYLKMKVMKRAFDNLTEEEKYKMYNEVSKNQE